MADITRVATHTWVNDAVPAINGTHLNDIETDLDAVFVQANDARAIASDTAASALLDTDPRVPPTPGSGDAGKVLTVKTDHSGYELDTPSGGGGAVSTVFGRAGTVIAASGDYTPDQVGAAEQLDYAYDISNVATVIPTSGSSVDIGLGISCPATGTNRSLIVRCGGAAVITVAGAGMIGLQIYESTAGGAAVLVGVSQITGSFTVGSGSAFPSFPSVSYDLGPSTTERQFILRAAMIRDASSSLAASVRSTATGVVRAWIEGVAM